MHRRENGGKRWNVSIASRLKRLEKALGKSDAPEMIVISTASDRHEIRWVNPWILGLLVPWDPKYRGHADPFDDLTDEQRRIIDSCGKVITVIMSPDELGPDRDIDGL
jgi:hypothetical protein